MSVKVQNITKLYGVQKALDDVSFEIRTGEIVGFLGPNGAGKTTMMKIITGFIPPTNGEVWVCEKNIKDAAIEVRRKIGYLPENNPLYLDMYVVEYLKFIAGVFHLGRNTGHRINEIIEQTGLGIEQHKKIGALSKGFRQRVGLAQALIHNPDVLILDEPTTGLDPNQIIEIRNLISQIGKEKTIMLSTHIMQEVEAICQRVIIINQGKIVADNNAIDIKKQNNEYQTVVVEFDRNVTETDLKSIDGVFSVLNLQNNSWLLQCSLNNDIRPKVFQFAVDKGIMVLSMQRQEKKLEDVFHELTKSK